MLDFVCAGNWKMNKTSAEAASYLKQLCAMATPEELAHLVLLPPALVASEFMQGVKNTNLKWGGQNCSAQDSGAFTGENSPLLLKEMGADFCLVGHSERRQLFGETDELIALKIEKLQSLNLTPIFCVGETLDDRRWNRTEEVIVRQTRQGLMKADPLKPLWLAYEPVWAIGTGLVATPEQVDESHAILRRCLKEWSAISSEKTPILYGGSVKSENASALGGLHNVNGFLIGGASLVAEEFLRVYRNSKS